MARIAYVNGRYAPLSDSTVNVEDRGLQFADSVYEVCAVLDGTIVDWDKHRWRLRRNLAALRIEGVMGDAALGVVARRLLQLNRLPDALLYIQVTRGTAPRDHLFPRAARSTVVMTVRRWDVARRRAAAARGIAVATCPDQRWRRCDIKTTALLANVLAKQQAAEAGGSEAWLVDEDGMVTEGGSTNAWLVDRGGTIVTRPLSGRILPGVMRDTLIDVARGVGLRIEERPFAVEEAQAAPEAFLTSTSQPCTPIVAIDGRPVGDGAPGPVSRRLADLLWAEMARQSASGRR